MPTRHTITVDGDEVVAVHHDHESDRWLFFSHGFVSDKSGSYEGRSKRAVKEGYNAVRFDHRGCGESDLDFGDQTLSTRIADLEAVIDHFDPDTFVLFGSSFGAKVIFHTAPAYDRIQAIVTRAPVTYNDIFDKFRPGAEKNRGGIGEAFFEDFGQYPFTGIEDEIDVPVAIFHGREDGTVPVSYSLDAVAALDTDVFFQQFADEGHRFSRDREDRLREQVFDWLQFSELDAIRA
jgi:pimeloyl-ACP methyl ester carboxylesterase